MLASLTLQEIGRSSDPTDLQCVTCCTHKEGSAAQRQLAKSAGMLCACLSEGLILHMQEIYGCELLSQRYLCLASVKALLPSLRVVVHDDACHLHKYGARRAQDGNSKGMTKPRNSLGSESYKHRASVLLFLA